MERGIRNPSARLPVLAAIAVAELVWFAWFLTVPLPNARNVGREVQRWILLVAALPGIVPELEWDDSHLGLALAELSHFENLPQRGPIALAALFIASAAVALGRMGLRALGLCRDLGRLERLGLAFGLGASILGVLTLTAGRIGALAPAAVRLALAVPILAEGLLTWRDKRRGSLSCDGQQEPRPPAWLLLVVAPFLLLMLLAAMLPTIDFDSLEYHLQGPKEYYQAGRITFLPHNVYTSMPFGVEMLHLLGMLVLGDWWYGALVGQVLVMLFAPAAGLIIYLAAARLGGRAAGAFAALVYLSTPWVYRLAAIPYVEGPLCYYHAALIAIGLRARDEGGPSATRLWGLIGVLAGGAMACKYPALATAVVPFGVLALAATVRRRDVTILPAYTAGWAVIMLPWLLRNIIDTANPVYPLAYEVFGGWHWDAARQARWAAAHGRKPIELAALFVGLIDVAGRSDWQSPLYFALGPLALLRRPIPRGTGALFAYAAYLFAVWWLLTHRLDRFWLPMLPPLAILAGLGADALRGRAARALLGAVLVLGLASNLVYISTGLASLNQWTGNLEALRVEVPRMLNPPLARLDQELDPHARILLVGQASVFHLRHPIVYNTVFNEEVIELLAADATPDQARAALARRGIDYVYVDWSEIERHRKPGGYGFSPRVTHEFFAGLVAAGVLEPPVAYGPRHELYRVIPPRRDTPEDAAWRP